MIELDGHRLVIRQLWEGAVKKHKCVLSPTARDAVCKSRDFVQRLAGQRRAVYGINTGFGPLSHTRVSPEDLGQHQINLIHHLSVGQGKLFSPAETRAIMIARANALARGYSGIREDVIELLLNCLNKGILPEIPTEGSVGASGDLIPLAHMARMLIGLGSVRLDGKRVPVKEAFKKESLSPIRLECKEGLALVNGTSVMTALMGLAAYDAKQILNWAELLSTCMIQVLKGAPEVLCEQLHAARGHRGQMTVGRRMTEYLRSHPDYARLIDEHHWGTNEKSLSPGTEVQDAYSVRCVPQILGAFQDAYWHIEQVATRELNAATDNPLVFPSTQSVIHGGNFYGQHIAMISDYLKTGLITIALLSERQLERLVNWRYSMGLPPLLTGADPGLNTGMGGCQILATSLAAEARVLATPASVQTIPTNANNQDVVSMGCTAAKQVRLVITILWKLLAIQSLALVQAADLREDKNIMGGYYKRLYDLVRNVSSFLKEDRPLYEDIQRVMKILQSDEIQKELFPKRPPNPFSME